MALLNLLCVCPNAVTLIWPHEVTHVKLKKCFRPNLKLSLTSWASTCPFTSFSISFRCRKTQGRKIRLVFNLAIFRVCVCVCVRVCVRAQCVSNNYLLSLKKLFDKYWQFYRVAHDFPKYFLLAAARSRNAVGGTLVQCSHFVPTKCITGVWRGDLDFIKRVLLRW
jgi:hypothetical protein